MAIYDPIEQRLCVRIVYDGVGGAGKTTNLKALCNLFATQRTTELFSPGEAEGRTLYFDWVQILAGAICGFPLMCQIISVPGQAVLTPRRRHLLSSADVVVFVCDSDPAAIGRAQRGLALIDEMKRDVPLLVQANKQDSPQALSGRRVLEALGRDAAVVEAIATEGVGVVDTFVAAVRVVSRQMHADSDAGRLSLDVGRAPAARDVLDRLKRAELDPAWAAEMFLEEAHAAFLLEGGFDREPVPMVAKQAPPMFPRPDVEVGFVWPAHTGRLVVEELVAIRGDDEPVLSADGTCELVLGGRRLRTSNTMRFEEREDARQALVRAARERTQLDASLASGTVLILQGSRDGAFWLWTIMPEAEPLSDVLRKADDRRPWLEGYAVAVAEVLRTGIRHGFSVDLSPSSFGVVNGAIRYFGDVGTSDTTRVSPNVVSAVDAVAQAGWESDVFLEAFERELARRLTPEEVVSNHFGAMSISSVPPA